MPRPVLSQTTTNDVVSSEKSSMLPTVVENAVKMGAVLTVEPDPTLEIHERVVDIRYGARGTIFGFHKDDKPDKDGLQQDVIAISFDKLYQTEWGLMKVAFVPRNMVVRESEWPKESNNANVQST